jgi:hypothetical protein
MERDVAYSLTAAFQRLASPIDKRIRAAKRKRDDERNASNKARRANWNRDMTTFHKAGKYPGSFELHPKE